MPDPEAEALDRRGDQLRARCDLTDAEEAERATSECSRHGGDASSSGASCMAYSWSGDRPNVNDGLARASTQGLDSRRAASMGGATPQGRVASQRKRYT